MANTMVKIKRPFDLLLNWHAYIDYINEAFSAPEEKTKYRPHVDINEKDGKYLLKMHLPGMELKDIHVDYKNGYLSIQGNNKNTFKNKTGLAHNAINHNGSFKTVIRFPDGIDEKRIHKTLKNGILRLTVPVPLNKNA